jgi:hypothetical protein
MIEVPNWFGKEQLEKVLGRPLTEFEYATILMWFSADDDEGGD